MKHLSTLPALAAALLCSASALAQTAPPSNPQPAAEKPVELNLGYAPSIKSCTRQGGNWVNERWKPSTQQVEQRVYLLLKFFPLQGEDLRAQATSCGQSAAAAVGMQKIVNDLAGQSPAFWTSFQGCMGDKYLSLLELGLNTRTECQWQNSQAMPKSYKR